MRSRRRILYTQRVCVCVRVCKKRLFGHWHRATVPSNEAVITNEHTINQYNRSFSNDQNIQIIRIQLTPRSTNMHISTHITRRERVVISFELFTDLCRFICILNLISFTSVKVAFSFHFCFHCENNKKKLRMFWTCSNDGGYFWLPLNIYTDIRYYRTILRIFNTFIPSVNAFDRSLFLSHRFCV